MWDAMHGANLTAGVPLQIDGVTALIGDRSATVDISGVWQPGTWERGGRRGYERVSTAEEAARFQTILGNAKIYLSFNADRGWWMVSPDPMCGTGTQGWAIVEAPDAVFPHQIARRASWKLITEGGLRESRLKVRAKPTAEFLLALSALVDRDGDEVIEPPEAARFSFGGLRDATPEEGLQWVSAGDADGSGTLTMREVADRHEELGTHRLAQRWLASTALVEATLVLLQKEVHRLRPHTAGTASEASTPETLSIEQDSPTTGPEECDADICTGEADAAGRARHQEDKWMPFGADSKCPIAGAANSAFDWGKAVLHRLMPKLLM